MDQRLYRRLRLDLLADGEAVQSRYALGVKPETWIIMIFVGSTPTGLPTDCEGIVPRMSVHVSAICFVSGEETCCYVAVAAEDPEFACARGKAHVGSFDGGRTLYPVCEVGPERCPRLVHVEIVEAA